MSSRSGEIKSESAAVKSSEKAPEKKGEDIMHEFLQVKDREKWKFFMGKLGKKDSDVLKSLLLSSDLESDKKSTCKRGHEKEETDSDEVKKPKATWRSKQKEQKVDNPVILIDSDAPKIKEEEEDKPKKDAENPQNKNSEPESKEQDKPNKDAEKPKIKEEGEKSEIKKEKNGSVEDTKPKIKKEKEKEKVEKEYFIYINGEKCLVRLVTGDEKPEDDGNDSDTSVKEEKQPKTLKAFYTVSDSDDNDEK